MGFFNRETIMPQVVQPYGPYEDVRGQLDSVYDQAQNRSSQKINQMYANVGMSPKGAPATAARARSTTDLENQRAQLGYQSYYDWLRGKQLVTPQIQPSGASTLAAPFISGIGQAAGPAIVSGATKGLGSAYNWMTGGSGGGDWGGNTYSAMSPQTGWDLSGGSQPDYGGYADVSSYDFGSDAGSAFDWMDTGSNLDYADAFNWF